MWNDLLSQMPDREEAARSNLLLAIISEVFENGTVSLILDGMQTATQKAYKTLASAWPLEAGDRVVVMKQSGTYVVLGPIGSGGSSSDVLPIENGGTGDSGVTVISTISEIITPSTGVTISSARLAKWGKLAMLNVTFQSSSSTSLDTSMISVGRLLDGLRPRINAPLVSSQYSGLVWSTGYAYLYGKYTANTTVDAFATYLLS